MPNLSDALKNYGKNSSSDDIIKGLQEGGYQYGLNAVTDQPIFQNYLITLLNSKSSEKLFESSKILNRWTKVLACATAVLVIATIALIFK